MDGVFGFLFLFLRKDYRKHAMLHFRGNAFLVDIVREYEALLEPAVILILAAVVLLVVLAIFLAIMEMNAIQ